MALQDNALLTLAELKAFLQITQADQDAAIESTINGVSDAVESLLGRRLASRTYTNSVRQIDPEWVLGTAWLDVEYPITALTALAVGDVLQTIWVVGSPGRYTDSDVFLLEGRDPKHSPDRIYRPAGWWVGEWVTLTYTAGYGPVGCPIPGDLKQAVLTLAGDWYYRRSRQADPVISRSAGAETVTYVNEALPRTFPTLVNAYRRWR